MIRIRKWGKIFAAMPLLQAMACNMEIQNAITDTVTLALTDALAVGFASGLEFLSRAILTILS
jgi:hypothetical protein